MVRAQNERRTKEKRRAAQTSIFHAWARQNVGGKHFVMAIWQTGVTWAPPPELLNRDYNGALKHVAKHFSSWTRRLARAVTRHKTDPATQEARIRSQHGLTPQQERNRAARAKARADYYQTVDLNNQLKASKGKGKCTEKKKSWSKLSWNERWWLKEYWRGRLRTALDEAEGRCHRVQAFPFRVLEGEC